jgi:hypothetical protein
MHDVLVEKEMAATTTEGWPISTSNKKTVSNNKTANHKKNSIDATIIVFDRAYILLSIFRLIPVD